MANEISTAQKKFIIKTIRAILPDAAILAFGSRIQGGAYPYSDLDIALKSKQPIKLSELGNLKEQFADSDLPFKVDLLDYQSTSDEFRQIINDNAQKW